MAIPMVGSPPAPKNYQQVLDADSSVFAAGVGSWTATGGTVTRDTTSGHKLGTLSASLKWASTTGTQVLSCVVPGTFEAGVPVDLLIALKVEEAPATSPRLPRLNLGVFGTDSEEVTYSIASADAPYDNQWRLYHLRWTPTAVRSGVTIRLARTTANAEPETWHVGVAKVIRAAGGAVADEIEIPGVGVGESPFGAGGFQNWFRRRLAGALGATGGWLGIGEMGSDEATGIGDNAMMMVYPVQPDDTEAYVAAPHTAGDHRQAGFNVQVGEDYVGLYFSEAAADEIQVYPDFGDYWMTLKDDPGGAKGWRAEDAAGNVTGLLSKSPYRQLAAAPGSPGLAETYYDTVLNKVRTWDGSAWQNHW